MAVIKGRSLNQAKKDAHYVSERRPGVLKDLGVISPQQADLLSRADAIGVGNRDSVTQADELSRLWRQDAFATLLTQERALLKGDDPTGPASIWKAFEITNAQSPLAELPKLKFVETPASIEPLDVNRRFEISSLPDELQTVAERVARSAKSGGKRATIRYRDVVDAQGPERAALYTESETKQLDELRRWALDQLQARSVVSAGLAISCLGEQTMNVSPIRELPVTLSWNDEVTWHFNALEGSMALARKPGKLTFTVPEGTRALVNGTSIEEAGPASFPAKPGDYLIEIFGPTGTKVIDTTFSLPNLEETIDLSEFERRPISILGGPRLEPDWVDSMPGAENWRWVPMGRAAPRDSVPGAAQQLSPPSSSLSDGTYRFSIGTKDFEFRKFSGHVYEVVDFEGRKHNLRFNRDDWGRLEFHNSAENLTLRFDPRTNAFAYVLRSDDHGERLLSPLDLVG